MDDQQVKQIEKMLTPELQAMARMIEGKIPEGWGFGLLIFRFSHKPGEPLLWVSNANREDMMETLREFVKKPGADG